MSSAARFQTVSDPAVLVPVLQYVNVRVVDGQAAVKSACEHCALQAICLPEGLSAAEGREYTALISQRRRLRAGETLFHAGDPLSHLYFVKTGSFKTVLLLDDGREQVTGFQFAGDVLGIDAISSSSHPSEAVALEETSVCSIPFAQLMRLSRRVQCLHTYLQRLLARELVRDQGLMLMLGRMHADERVVAFLRNLSNCFLVRGYSPHEFTLPMAREDIGNYLGLTLETVSRCFSRLKNAGVIEVDNRRVRIPSVEALRRAVGTEEQINGKSNGITARQPMWTQRKTAALS